MSVILKMSLLGWTQQGIADVVGVDQRTVSVITKSFTAKEIQDSRYQLIGIFLTPLPYDVLWMVRVLVGEDAKWKLLLLSLNLIAD